MQALCQQICWSEKQLSTFIQWWIQGVLLRESPNVSRPYCRISRLHTASSQAPFTFDAVQAEDNSLENESSQGASEPNARLLSNVGRRTEDNPNTEPISQEPGSVAALLVW